SMPVTATDPAPKATTGMKLGVFHASECSKRNSAPPLKACLPFVQLSVSAKLYKGLTAPRVLPAPAVLMKFCGNRTGFTRTGMPLYFGMVASAACPSASGLSNAAHPKWILLRRPPRNSFTTVGDRVDTSDSV